VAPFVVLLAVVVVWVTGHMNPGVDTWLALASGRYIQDHGPALVDPFSFASLPAGGSWWHPSGWVNQNWLSHLGLARLAGGLGFDGLVALKLVLYLAVAGLLAAAARVRGADWWLGCLAAAAALACSRDWLELRPADATNLMVALLLLVVTAACHRPAWLWAAVPILAAWCNLHGGFVFGLGVLGLLAAFSVGGTVWPNLSVGALPRGHAVAVAAAAWVAAVAASPYRLANLTHPLEVSAGAHAAQWRQVSEWRPLLDAAGVGRPGPYLALVGTGAVLLAVWLPGALREGAARRPESAGAARGETWFDLALISVAVAMSLASRRFVPLAAFVLAPAMAQWAAELGRRWSLPSGAAARLRRAVPAVAWAGALLAGLAVGRGVALFYLAPWPPDGRYASVFQRLTHGYLRPHGAMEFLAANAVRGRLLAPWEEGGFVAAVQRPERPGGRIPLQVLIDGRAQEAFPASTLQAYQELMAAGPAGGALTRPGGASTAEAAAARSWVEQRLDALGIGLVLFTPSSAEGPLARVLFNSPAWHVVYLDEHHSLLASHALQAELVAAVNAGRTAYPDGQSAAVTRAYLGLRKGNAEGLDQAFGQARAACEPVPSARAVGLAAQAAAASGRHAELRSWLRQLAERVMADWPELRQHDGCYRHLAAARQALAWLHEDAIRRGDGPVARWAGEGLERTGREEEALRRRVVW